ncbi:MaoC/PaaZ C-terminal domain-containing protein [Mycolicibacterium stellerae]|uniref:MaoC/PaaZ C-terminal domain-containing protein n=1 Tax=Mycolicibacterium stellerae TaxID=2358193 RepID=UPI000F0B2771|nr:MaoC/PaaZ C-terminal domain-containing protein [Mycolicibacterium stellerae]
MTVNPGRHGPYPGHLDPEAISAYAAATGDDTASVAAGAAVPAIFPVILVFTAVETARADIPEEAWARVRGGVHGEHDIVLHRPLVPGESLTTWSQISGMRASRAGTRVTVHLEQIDADGLPAVEQWWTMVLLGLDGLPDLGTMPAEHRFPDTARANPLGSTSHRIEGQTAHRYAEVSGDWSAHHFHIEAARAAGFDFVFAHGLATMAICTHRMLGILGVDDPGMVARVAVRFASATPLGCDLTVNAYGVEQRSLAFEATAGGATTITHGRLELRR